MIVKFPVLGKDGLIKDYPTSDLPQGAWTSAQNVRFRDNLAELIYGHGELSDNTGTSGFIPYNIFHQGSASSGYFLMMGTAHGYVSLQGDGAWAQVTRLSSNYTGSATDKWVGGAYGGNTIITNNVDVPQLWTGGTTKLIDLTNWTSTKRCLSIRPYRNAWVALNTTESSVNYPHRVLISDLSDPGSVPGSWDETDATKNTFETDIYGEDHIVDGGQLRDAFIIYKERSCYLLQWVGGFYLYRVDLLHMDTGMLTQHCWTEIQGKHLVLTPGDLVLVDPYSQPQSVIDARTKRYLFQNIDSANNKKCFVSKQPYFNEAWVFFPSQGNTWCDMALVWNYKYGTCTLREVPAVAHAVVAPTSDTLATDWDTDSGTWDGDTLGWGSNEFTPSNQRIVMASPTNVNITLGDSGTKFYATAIGATLEKTGIDFGAPDKYKLIRSVRPHMYGGSNTVTIQLGSHNELHGNVTWDSAKTFTIDSGYQIDSIVNGRYGAIRITSTSDAWRLESMEFDLEIGEEY